MKQGCLLVDPALIATPDIFDALSDAFNIIRHVEVDASTHILIVEHDEFQEINEGDFLPFYDIDTHYVDDVIKIKEISLPFTNLNFCLKCQSKKETNTNTEQREENRIILLT